MTLNTASKTSPTGAAHQPDRQLNQRKALRAAGRRLVIVPGRGPGPLVEQDGNVPSGAGTGLRPLRAAPMPVPTKAVGGTLPAAPVRQRMSLAGAGTLGLVEVLGAAAVCQAGVDLKAFTGKGDPRAVRVAAKVVDDIHAQMRALSQASVLLGKNQLYLTVHARKLTNQHSLRWRGYTVVDGKATHKHLTWDEAFERVRQQPYAVRIQMQVWDKEARDLNEAEQAARTAVKRLNKASVTR